MWGCSCVGRGWVGEVCVQNGGFDMRWMRFNAVICLSFWFDEVSVFAIIRYPDTGKHLAHLRPVKFGQVQRRNSVSLLFSSTKKETKLQRGTRHALQGELCGRQANNELRSSSHSTTTVRLLIPDPDNALSSPASTQPIPTSKTLPSTHHSLLFSTHHAEKPHISDAHPKGQSCEQPPRLPAAWMNVSLIYNGQHDEQYEVTRETRGCKAPNACLRRRLPSMIKWHVRPASVVDFEKGNRLSATLQSLVNKIHTTQSEWNSSTSPQDGHVASPVRWDMFDHSLQGSTKG